MKNRATNRSRTREQITVDRLMENLYIEIKVDIFSRLPFESLLQCRRVCKTWRALLHDLSFAHMLLQHRRLPHFNDYEYHNYSNPVASKMGFLLLGMSSMERLNQLYYGEYDENDEQSFKKLTKINHPPLDMCHSIVGSCNGLVCFSVRHHYVIEDPVYICNPITREYVNLPRFNISIDGKRYLNGRMVSGFGYYPSTNEYKVVRIYYSRDQPFVGRVQVYTLGGTKFLRSRWRNKLKITYILGDRIDLSPGILANGALHWLDEEGMIVAFDLADEEFRVLPLPPCYSPYVSFKLHVLGGCLALVHQRNDKSTEIWTLKKKKKKSRTSYEMKEQDCHSWSWNREFSSAVEIINRWKQPFTITKSGEIVLWYHLHFPERIKSLARYDPKTANLEKLGDLDKVLNYSEARSHINSFVSLKALGEDAKILESTDELD
ncbi:F-box domain [Macleaya cordata]|uniref:F-box domain n=1 Tax=Macleaya cordata TaxID=56857 RepID=A0A200Q750_MACCD|nr:F-box domain [Macleaya cordata]